MMQCITGPSVFCVSILLASCDIARADFPSDAFGTRPEHTDDARPLVVDSAPKAVDCSPYAITNEYWVRGSTTAVSTGSHTWRVDCPGAGVVVSGGCYIAGNASRLVRSSPHENGNSNDNPDNNECMQHLDGVTGWSCQAHLVQGETLYVLAMCQDVSD
jgi:hypothetical protein